MSRKKIRNKKRKVSIREIKLDELKGIIERAKASLSEEDGEKLEAAVDTLAFLTNELEKKGVSIQRLRKLIFGSSTEKTSQVFKDTAEKSGGGSGADVGSAEGGDKKEEGEDQEGSGNLSTEVSTRLLYLDSDIIPGSFYVSVVWFWPTDKKDEASPAPHTHDFPEVIDFFGTDPNNINDLGAEIKIYINNERNLIDKSFMAFIPAGVVHNPLNILKITKPVLHFATFPSATYTGTAK